MKQMAAAISTQSIPSRPFQGEEDFWGVRRLLVDTYPITPTGFNWEIRRWDGWRYHNECTELTPEWGQRIHLWETLDGQLVGVAHPDGRSEAVLQLHPDYRHIEEEMITWAEANLAVPSDDNWQRQLDFSVLDYDSPRRRLLEKRGYAMTPRGFVVRRLRFGNKPLPQPVLAAGYCLRSTRPHDEDDYRQVAAILNSAFNRTFHTEKEFRSFATESPSFRHDLNLVAQTQDGAFAALVGVTYDQANRRGIFEPVCTHPEHRRRGLARTLMLEGMHRLKALGASDAYVDTGDAAPANALYEDVGFTEAYRGRIWRKVF